MGIRLLMYESMEEFSERVWEKYIQLGVELLKFEERHPVKDMSIVEWNHFCSAERGLFRLGLFIDMLDRMSGNETKKQNSTIGQTVLNFCNLLDAEFACLLTGSSECKAMCNYMKHPQDPESRVAWRPFNQKV